MWKKILLGLAALLAGFVVVVAMQPSDYHVERSVQVNAPASVVWADVSDFEQWKRWNPWDRSDPTQKTTITGEPGTAGHTSAWVGEKTGSGTMKVTEVAAEKRVAIELAFKEPMASTADTAITLAANGEGVEVTWSMDGKNDFAGKFFGLVMGVEDMIGASYEEGLGYLKEVAEEDAKKAAVAAAEAAAAAQAAAEKEAEADAAPPTEGEPAAEAKAP